MKVKSQNFKLSILSIAVASFFASFAAYADEEEAAALKTPVNTIEIGVVTSSQDSAKYGEYSGMNKAGTYSNLNVTARGGDAYGKNEEGQTTRWSINANDLGLTSRSISGNISDQGSWSIGVGYDELKHNLSNTYQTPYLGNNGGNSFTLPSPFGYVSAVAVASDYSSVGNLTIRTLNSNGTTTTSTNTNWSSYLHNLDISSTRENSSINGTYIVDSALSLNFDYNHLKQSGAKLQAFAQSTDKSMGTTNYVINEKIAILPMPTNYQTDTLSFGANWLGQSSRLSGSYFGSFFRDGYDRVGFQPWYQNGSGGITPTTQYMSTAPSNILHQINLSGGYDISTSLKMVGNFSRGHNTQNSNFVNDTILQVTAPSQTSLNGVVDTTHADLKLTDQVNKDLTLAGGVKFDERKNGTASNMYNYYSISGSAPYNYANTPLSTRKTQFDFSADFRIDSLQKLKLSYNHEQVNRWCENYAASMGVGTNCVVAKESRDDKAEVGYKYKLAESGDLKLGYGYSDRKTDSDIYAKAAIAGYTSSLANNLNVNNPTGSSSGLQAGQNAGDWLGFYPYFDATRTQHFLKAGAAWQVNEKLSYGLSGKYTRDNYGDSTYGVQSGSSWSANFDVTYAYAESGSVYGYLTQQNRRRDMRNYYSNFGASNSSSSYTPLISGTWDNALKSYDTTLGLGAKHDGLLYGKLNLKGDLTYSLAKSNYSTFLNYSPATYTGVTTTSNSAAVAVLCTDPTIMTCGSLPDIKSNFVQMKLSGVYQLDKTSKLSLMYVYQHLQADDYYYNGLQAGTQPTGLIPTNQQAGGYNIHAVGLSYLYNF